ncbi:MAG: DUF3014 domain-containing protein [Casimicrobiaceae bacterium]
MSDPTQARARHEPALASLPLSDDDSDERRNAAGRSAASRRTWIAILTFIAVMAAAIIYWRMQAPPQAPALAETPPPAPPAAASAETAPAIRYPIDAARAAGEAAAPPPAAAASGGEAAFLAGLFALPGAGGLDRLVVTEDSVHRLVATVDNLPRASVASKVMAVQPAEGAFTVETDDGRTVIGRANAARYTAYLRMLQAVDTAPLVALYVRNYPMFQQAYRDLGYPNGYFNDRLVDVIDNLLATPEAREPAALLQPRVLYEYANPDLESRSAGQKAMLRLGAENARAAKAKLREMRSALTASPAPR